MYFEQPFPFFYLFLFCFTCHCFFILFWSPNGRATPVLCVTSATHNEWRGLSLLWPTPAVNSRSTRAKEKRGECSVCSAMAASYPPIPFFNIFSIYLLVFVSSMKKEKKKKKGKIKQISSAGYISRWIYGSLNSYLCRWGEREREPHAWPISSPVLQPLFLL